MDEQLKRLYDYTKFHIGMYTTIIAAIIGVFANEEWNESYADFVPFMLISLACFLLAGAFGGLVASGAVYYTSFQSFMEAKLGPWRYEMIEAKKCTHLEHLFFWLGSGVAVTGLAYVIFCHC